MKKLLLTTCSAVALLWAAPAAADPFSAAIAATLSASATAGGIGALSFSLGSLTLTGAGAFAAQVAVRAALGYALNALTSKPSGVSRGYSTNVNQIAPSMPHQIIYGETKVGGAIFYQTLTSSNASSQDRLHRCIAFAGHEIDSYQAIYLNDEEVTLDATGNVTHPTKYDGLVRIREHLGTDDQIADSALVGEVPEWTSAHRARGIAYLYVRFEDASEFESIPVVSAKIRGKKIYDPRTSTTAWSDNPAMIIRDYLLADFGLEEVSANIEENLFEAAADVCDETVAGADRYTCNGSFLLDASPEDIIRTLLSSMGGIFWNYSGQWAIQAAEYQTPTLTLTEDDLRSDLEINTRHSRRDNFNSVVGQYKGPATSYQPDNFTEVSSGRFLLEDNNIRAATELNLLFTDTEVMAQRIARTYLRRNRKQITVSGSFGLRALDLKIGDNVMLSVDHLSWSSKVFEVVDWRLGIKDLDIQVYMILREMSDEVFNGILETLTDESDNTLTDESDNTLEAITA
jgi:hypothetical protein